MSNRFDNRIQDGLDDLISGVTGIRRSKVGKIKTWREKRAERKALKDK